MKHTLLILCFLTLSLIGNAQYNRNWQALPYAPISYRLDDIYFLNPQLGWAINPGFGGSYSQYGRIMKTYDGGNTWTILKDSTYSYFRSIGFADSLVGWVGTLNSRSPSDTIVLNETRDGGLTWHSANIPYPHPAGVCGISVVTDSVVYAYGRFYGPAGYLKTNNKGASWEYINLDSMASGLIDGYFFNKDTGFLTGAGLDKKAIILRTNNGGTTWQVCYHSNRSDTDGTWKIVFQGGSVGYATVEHWGNAPNYNSWFLKTTDRGQTWTERPFIRNYSLQGIGFLNDSMGWIGGDNEKPNYVTTDGGNTWGVDTSFGILTPPLNFSSGFFINRFRRFGDTLMYASGNTVYKLNTNTPTAIQKIRKESKLYNNYPNPFKNQTTISYYLPSVSSEVVITVYDMKGAKIASENLGTINKGNHQYVFNADIPAGTYLYTIGTEWTTLKGKMVVAK